MTENPRAGKRGGKRSTTRVGNGAGWGGPAGGGKPLPFSADHQPSPEAKSEGHARAATAAAEAQKYAPEMVHIWLEVARKGTSEMARVKAAEALVNRAEGAPVQRVNLNMDPDQMTDEELAKIAAAGATDE